MTASRSLYIIGPLLGEVHLSTKINWRRVLSSANIEFVERGPNVKRGEINIRCPWCGNADPSHHLGIAVDTTGWWACWRNQSHRGKSPVRLLVKLLGCSVHRALELAGLTEDYIDPDGFDAVAARVMSRDGLQRMVEVRRDFLQLPKEFVSILPTGRTSRHWGYLTGPSRTFMPMDIRLLEVWYLVRAAVSGNFKDRVILPYIMNGEIVAWTGRAIASSKYRYLDLPKDECLVEIKKTLFNHDATLKGGEVLLVVEGPFDSLKLDLYGRDWGVRAVGLSTNSISDEQTYLLEEASYRFDRTLIMMDNASQLGIVDSMRMKEQLSQVRNLGFVPVPFNKKDGGDLSPSLVISFCRSITT